MFWKTNGDSCFESIHKAKHTFWSSSVFVDISINSVNGTTCTNALQCQGQTINDIARCHGYYACYQATIDSSSSVTCSGAYGCQDAVEITSTTTTHCIGANACQDAASITAGTIAYCDGYYSCADVDGTISASDDIYCYIRCWWFCIL